MKVLVTGTEGYLGSLLAPLLLQQGYEVVGVDTGFYKMGWLYNGTELTAKTLNKDIRHITIEDLQGVDAVVHMAELSNDPAGQLAPNVTYDINHKAHCIWQIWQKQPEFVALFICLLAAFTELLRQML